MVMETPDSNQTNDYIQSAALTESQPNCPQYLEFKHFKIPTSSLKKKSISTFRYLSLAVV